MPTVPTAVAAAPAAPDRTDRTTFSTRVHAMFVYIKDTFIAAINALATNVYNNAVEAYASALAAANSATAAAASMASAGAVLFNPATNYAEGEGAISALDHQLYRRKSAGVSADDPKLDDANWERAINGLGFGGAANQAVPLTLSHTSAGVMTLTSPGPGNALTMPDARTCSEGSALWRWLNTSPFDIPLRNDGGVLQGFIPPGGVVTASLVDNATANGVWLFHGATMFGCTSGARVSPIGALSGVAAQNMAKAIAIDADRDLVLWADVARLNGVVVNHATNTIGAVTAVRTSSGLATNFSALLIGVDQVLVTSCNATTAFEAVPLAIAGETITPGTAGALALSANMSDWGDLVAVGATYVQSYYKSAAAAGSLLGITVAGTVATVGAEQASANATNAPVLFVKDAVLVAFTANATVFTMRPYTLAGTVFTPGTSATTTITVNTIHAAKALASGRWAFVLNNSNTLGVIANLAGTVGTLSTVALSGSTLSGFNNHVVASTLLLQDSNNVYSLVDNAGVAVAGTVLALRPSTSNSGLIGVTDTAMWVACYGSSGILTSCLAIGLAGNDPVVLAQDHRLLATNAAGTRTTLMTKKQAVEHVFQNTLGITTGNTAAAEAGVVAFDGQVLRLIDSPAYLLGSNSVMTPLQGDACAASLSKSVKYALHQERSGLSSSLGIYRVEAA